MTSTDKHDSPPWFCKQLHQPTADDTEHSLCADWHTAGNLHIWLSQHFDLLNSRKTISPHFNKKKKDFVALHKLNLSRHGNYSHNQTHTAFTKWISSVLVPVVITDFQTVIPIKPDIITGTKCGMNKYTHISVVYFASTSKM